MEKMIDQATHNDALVEQIKKIHNEILVISTANPGMGSNHFFHDHFANNRMKKQFKPIDIAWFEKPPIVPVKSTPISDEDLIRITRKLFCDKHQEVNYFPFKNKKEARKAFLKMQRQRYKQINNPMNETVLQRIIAFVIGHKYYANIIRTKGLGGTVDLTSFIHPTKADALAHRRDIEQTASYSYVETISFRSRETYVKTFSPDGVRTGQQIK